MPRGGISPVAVLAIIMAVVASLPSQLRCSQKAGKPNLNDIEVKNVAHGKGQVLANMAGYLELLGDNINLPLDMKSIHNAKCAKDHLKHTMVMFDEHVHMIITYYARNEGDLYDFTKIEMSVNNGTHRVGSYEEICKFDEPFVFSLPVDSRYSCQKVLIHQCSLHKKPVANLVLKSFEIEIDGDQEKTTKREFSKPAWEESCGHWKGIERPT